MVGVDNTDTRAPQAVTLTSNDSTHIPTSSHRTMAGHPVEQNQRLLYILTTEAWGSGNAAWYLLEAVGGPQVTTVSDMAEFWNDETARDGPELTCSPSWTPPP